MTTSARRWAKTDATQQRILDAATDVFAARGFTAATMADIVDRSGASIGSIYHHFGGKKELFLAIFDRMAAEIEHRIDAVMHRRLADVANAPSELTARAYLEAIWANRHAAIVLAPATTPADSTGFAADGMLTSFRRWMSSIELDTSPRGQLLTRPHRGHGRGVGDGHRVRDAADVEALIDHRRSGASKD